MLTSNQPSEWDKRFGPALLVWANAQTPSWIRTKIDPLDLVQQTLLEAIPAQHKLAAFSDSELLGYLRRALSNNLIDAARKYERQRNDLSPDALVASSVRLANWLAADHSTPSEQAARNERFANLAVGLSRLPDDQRVAVEMRYLQNATVGEIATVLNRSVGAVSKLLHRAVLALRNNSHILDS